MAGDIAAVPGAGITNLRVVRRPAVQRKISKWCSCFPHLTNLQVLSVAPFTVNESLWLAIGKHGVELEHFEAHPSDRR
ncbi:hypothetical protein D3C87_1813350 [compost metagenome]